MVGRAASILQVCLLSESTGVLAERYASDGDNLTTRGAEARRRAAYTKPNPDLEPLSDTWLDFFKQRCIDPAILERNGIKQSVVNGKVSPVLVFPYFRDGELINAKYRTLEKKFWQSRGAEKVRPPALEPRIRLDPWKKHRPLGVARRYSMHWTTSRMRPKSS